MTEQADHRRAVALICLIQAVELLTALIKITTSPADDTARQVLDRIDRLIADAEDLMGITRTEEAD